MDYQKLATRIAPLVQALAEGKTLQFRDPKLKGTWEDVYGVGLYFYEGHEYRIKPQPMKDWREQVLAAVQGYTMACIALRTGNNPLDKRDATAEAQARHDKLVALLNNIPKED